MKYFNFLLTSLLILIFGSITGQNSFELLIENDFDQAPNSLIELDDGNIVCAIFGFESTQLIKINEAGEVVDSLTGFNAQNSYQNYAELIPYNDSGFFLLGETFIDSNYFMCHLFIDYQFNIISEHLIPVPGKMDINFIHGILNSNGNIVVCASYEAPGFNNKDILIKEIEADGTVIKENYWGASTGGSKIVFDIAELTPGKYIITSNAINLNSKDCFIFELDSNLNIVNQGYDDWNLTLYNDIVLLNESTFLISGIKIFLNSYENQIGVLKMDLNFNKLDSIHFGKLTDTVDYPGFHNNLDKLNNEHIFICGTANMDKYTPIFSNNKSWFIISKFDQNFNTSWEKYYGGDAYYQVWSLCATQDGGCVVAGTRYDYLTQNQERDVYILKVNEDGLITWAHNVPMVKKEIIVYPNPGRDKLMVKSATDNLSFDLYNSSGKKLITHELRQPESEINTSVLEPGVFVYKIKNKKGQIVETGKWIKK